MFFTPRNTLFYLLSSLLLASQQAQSMDYLRGMQTKETFKAMAYVIGGAVIGSIGHRLLSSNRDSLFASNIKRALDKYLIEFGGYTESDIKGKGMEDAEYLKQFSTTLSVASDHKECGLHYGTDRKEAEKQKKRVSGPSPNQVDRNNLTFGDQVKETMNGVLAEHGMQIDECRSLPDDTRLGLISGAMKAAAEHTKCGSRSNPSKDDFDFDKASFGDEEGALSRPSGRKVDMDSSLGKRLRDLFVKNGTYTKETIAEATNDTILTTVEAWAAEAKEYGEEEPLWKHKLSEIEKHFKQHYPEAKPLNVYKVCRECGWTPTPYKPEDL